MKKIFHLILLSVLYIVGFIFLTASITHPWQKPVSSLTGGFPYDNNKLDDTQKISADRAISRTHDAAIYATKEHVRLCENEIDNAVEQWSTGADGSKEVIQLYREYISSIDNNYFLVEPYYYRASKCDLYIYNTLEPRKNGTTNVKIFYDKPTGAEEKNFAITITD